MATTAPTDPHEWMAHLARLSDEGARLAFLRGNRQLRDPAVVDLLYEEVVRLVRVDVQQADRLAQATAWIARRLGDDYCKAQSWRAVGHVRLTRGKYSEALRSYEKALSIFRRAAPRWSGCCFTSSRPFPMTRLPPGWVWRRAPSASYGAGA